MWTVLMITSSIGIIFVMNQSVSKSASGGTDKVWTILDWDEKIDIKRLFDKPISL